MPHDVEHADQLDHSVITHRGSWVVSVVIGLKVK